jgi:hypothetical protein
LAGISAITEIYPFSGWSNINTFLIQNSKLANFDITLPQNIGNDGGTPTVLNKGLFFKSNAAINNFSPRYHIPSGKTMQCLVFDSNNFNNYDLNIDATQKTHWLVSISNNTNLKTINFSGYQGGVGGIERKNSAIFSVINHPQLTGITFWPNNGYGFSSYSINMFGGGYTGNGVKSFLIGGLTIDNNPLLNYFDSVFSDSPNRYSATITNNGFVDWTSPFIFDNPYNLNFYNNKLTGFSPTFSTWPLNQCKKAPSIYSSATNNAIYNAVSSGSWSKWNLSYLSKDSGLTKNDYYYLSGQVTSITVVPDNKGKGRYVYFNINPSRALMGVYVQDGNIPRQDGIFAINDDGKFWTGFNFDCEDDEIEEIKKLRGKYKFQLYYSPSWTAPNRLPTTMYSAETLVRTTPIGTFTPNKPCILYFQAENALDLSNNNFTTGITESYNNNILNLPNNLHRFKMVPSAAKQNILKKFSTSLNKNLVHFLVSLNKSLNSWDGDVSAATKITYFDVSDNALTGWTKQFSTEDTQYDAYTTTFDTTMYCEYGGVQTTTGAFPSFLANSTSDLPYINMVDDQNLRIINYYRPTGLDARGYFFRFGLFNKNLIKDINLYNLYPFNHINLGDNPLSAITNLSLHPSVYYLNVSKTYITDSQNLIPNNEEWPSTLKILTATFNNVNTSLPSLTSWTKSFSGLVSSTGVTPTDMITATNYDYDNESLILDFRGQYKLYGTSGFDFIVRDLVTGKTNGVYFSGGSLLVSGRTVSSTEKYNVFYALSSAPTEYTGFTLSDGNKYVVSEYGYMADWVNILTGKTIGETTGRGFYTDLYPSKKSGFVPITSPISNNGLGKRSSLPVDRCNELVNASFENNLDSWDYGDDWSWTIENGGSAQYIGSNGEYSYPISQNNSLITDVLYSVSLMVYISQTTTQPCTIRVNLGTNSYQETFPAGGGTFRMFTQINCVNNRNFSIEVLDNNTSSSNVYINKIAVCNMNISNSFFDADSISAVGASRINVLTNNLPVISWSGANWCNASDNYDPVVRDIFFNGTAGFATNRWYLLSFTVYVETGGSCTVGGSGQQLNCNNPLMGPRTASVFLGRTFPSITYNTLPTVPTNLLSDYRINIDGTNQTYEYNFLIKMPSSIGDINSEIILRTDNTNCGSGVTGPNGEPVGFWGTISLGISQIITDPMNQPNSLPQLLNTDGNNIVSRFKYNNGNSTTTGGIEFVGTGINWTSIKVNCTSANAGNFCSSLTSTPPPISPNWKYQLYITNGTNFWIYRVTGYTESGSEIILTTNTTSYPTGSNTTLNPNVTTGSIYISIIY